MLLVDVPAISEILPLVEENISIMWTSKLADLLHAQNAADQVERKVKKPNKLNMISLKTDIYTQYIGDKYGPGSLL